jgi:glycosyltransferase involved in cell wall biosynthesis
VVTTKSLNLLLFNLATDADDPILGFTTQWINRLAAHYERIDVVTMRAGRQAVAPNVCVWSVGKEQGYSEARRLVEFYRILSRLLQKRRYKACFAHMMPLFAVLGAPLLRNIPITLWYTHRQAHRTLQMATAVSHRVVTAADSFPLTTDKLRVIGHGIDTEFFSPGEKVIVGHEPTEKQTIIQVARLMPIKHQATLIRALAEVSDAHGIFIGDVPPGANTAYRTELETLAHELGVAERVTFTGNLSPESVRKWNRRAAVSINLSPSGLFDKAALESMAVGVPTIVASDAFDAEIDGDARLRIPSPDDSAALAARLRALLALGDRERAQIGAGLRQRVMIAHSLAGLITRLVSVLNTGEPA